MPDTSLPLSHTTRARSLRGALALLAVLAFVGALAFFLQAHPAICLFILMGALPLLWDMARDAGTWFELTQTTLSWRAGRHTGSLPLSQIDRTELVIRMDLSSKLTVVLNDGQRLRLPPACLPGPHGLEAALMAADVPVIRKFFSLS